MKSFDDAGRAGIRDEVRRIVESAAPEARDLADDASIFEAPFIDSLIFLTILSEVERRFALSLSSGEAALADLGSIRALAACVEGRRAAGSITP